MVSVDESAEVDTDEEVERIIVLKQTLQAIYGLYFVQKHFGGSRGEGTDVDTLEPGK